MTGAAIEVHGLGHRFTGNTTPLTVLDDLHLDVEPGDHVALVGPSGAGKSTLLALLGGLEPPQTGALIVDGQDLATLSRDGLAEFRRRTVGFVFQHFGLLDTLTAAENIELAVMLDGAGRRDRRRRALELLDAVGLAERATHQPGQLSGGERQRVAIARALANRPRLLLADEPTGNLDEDSSRAVIELLESLRVADGCTLVVVTHNRIVAGRAERRLALRHGHLEPLNDAP
jgi:putative ABC transport system ATP-binding protein